MKVKVEKLLGISYFRPPYVSIAIVHFCYFRSFNFLRSPVYPTKKKRKRKNHKKRVRRDTSYQRRKAKVGRGDLEFDPRGWLIARIRISLLWVVQRYGAVGGIVQPLRCETARPSAIRSSAIPVSSRGTATFAIRWPELRRYSVHSYLL